MGGVIVPGVVLAGGRSSRMGRPKPLLPVDAHNTFVTRLVRTLRDGGVDDLVVVVSGDGPVDAIAAALAVVDPEPRIVLNPDSARGQLSSLLVGLAAIDRPGVTGMLMTLVDLPLVSSATVRRLLEAYTAARPIIVRPLRVADGAHGHPVIFDRAIFDELRGASDETGVKPIVRAHDAGIANIPVDDAGAFLDIDTPDDYARVFGRPPPAGAGSR